MASFDGTQPHVALSKDVNVGGIRLLSSITPFHFDNRDPPVKSLPPTPLNNMSTNEGTSLDVVKRGGSENETDFNQIGAGSGEGGNVKHISTTEAEIERARSDLQNRHINIKSIRNAQSLLRGQGGKKQSGKSKAKSKKGGAKKKSQGKKKTTKSKPAKKKAGKKTKKTKSGQKKKSSKKQKQTSKKKKSARK